MVLFFLFFKSIPKWSSFFSPWFLNKRPCIVIFTRPRKVGSLPCLCPNICHPDLRLRLFWVLLSLWKAKSKAVSVPEPDREGQLRVSSVL